MIFDLTDGRDPGGTLEAGGGESSTPSCGDVKGERVQIFGKMEKNRASAACVVGARGVERGSWSSKIDGKN